MTEIHTTSKGRVAELRSFEEKWFSFEGAFTGDAPTPSLEVGGFDFEPIKELLNSLKLGIMCTLPRFLKGDSQYRTPVEFTIVNQNPELEAKFHFDQNASTLLVEELCEWTVEIRALDENSTSILHSFEPTGKGDNVVWLAHWSFYRREDIIIDREKYGEYQLDSFCSCIDLYEDERLVGRVPVRYPLEELFSNHKNQISVLRGDNAISLPTPEMHHESLRWFSPDTDEVATQYLPQEVGEITYYLKGWCEDEEQWIQVIDDKEMPVTWNIKVRDWDFQAFIDSIEFRLSGDENGILITGKWGTKGRLPSTIRWNMVAAETMDGFSVEIRQDSIDIRCDATNGYSAPIKFQINGFDDVAERTFDFPSDIDFGAEALDCIAVTFITRDSNIIAIDYDTTQLPEGLTKTIHLWVGTNYGIEIYPNEHKTVRLDRPLQTASIFAETSWHPYGKAVKQELTMVVEKVTQPSPYALGMHDEYLAWHPQLKGLNNQTPSELDLDYHLVSVNAELELDDVHDITLRPILFQFHDDGETTVHKLTTFDSTYETQQPYCIFYNENDVSLTVLRLNDDQLFDIELNDDFEIGPNGGLKFRKPGHYIYAVQPTGYVYFDTPKFRRTGNHEPIVDYRLYNASNGNAGFGRRYTTVVCIEVV